MEQDDADSTQPVALSRGKTNLALATLFLGMFVLGSGELLVVGLLPWARSPAAGSPTRMPRAP
jgi:hypothetical protein